MSTVEASTELAMPRARAWEILRDLGIAHRYVPGLVRTEIRSMQTQGVGATRRVYRAKGEGLDETVVDWVDGHGFLLRLHKPDGTAPAPFAAASFRYRLDDVPGHAGHARMTIALDYEPRWGAGATAGPRAAAQGRRKGPAATGRTDQGVLRVGMSAAADKPCRTVAHRGRIVTASRPAAPAARPRSHVPSPAP